MKCKLIGRNIALGLLIATAASTSGCGRAVDDGAAPPAVETSHEGEAGAAHDRWWCVEHGIPEEECSMCSARAADDFKAKGDWCQEHNRAESQCFVCDPSRQEKFAAIYEAKFGHGPPAPTQ